MKQALLFIFRLYFCLNLTVSAALAERKCHLDWPKAYICEENFYFIDPLPQQNLHTPSYQPRFKLEDRRCSSVCLDYFKQCSYQAEDVAVQNKCAEMFNYCRFQC